MKLIIFSDSHGDICGMREVMRRHGDADAVLHLGDGTKEFLILSEEYRGIPFCAVPGNYEDPYAQSPTSTICLSFGKYNFLLTHGHGYGIKSGEMQNLLYAARQKKADAVLFGHTHEKFLNYSEGIYIFNPGSISRPRDNERSYGVCEIKENAILFSHGEI